MGFILLTFANPEMVGVRFRTAEKRTQVIAAVTKPHTTSSTTRITAARTTIVSIAESVVVPET